MKRIYTKTLLPVAGACFALCGLAMEAEASSWRLVCFEKAALEKSLDRIKNPQQFLRNDRLLKSGSCDFAQIPKGSKARFSAFYQSKNGFIFPTFQVRYSTTSQRMYSADGIFLASAWRVSSRFRDCRNSSFDDTCIVPKTCQSLDGFINAAGAPSYVAVPSSCRTFKTQ